MKKILSLIIITILLSGSAWSQVKVRFSLVNPHIDQGMLVYDMRAVVPAQQMWRVGPTCIRVGYTSIPDSAFDAIEDNPATNANLNIHNNFRYGNMTTTSIKHDSAISLNVLKLLTGNTHYFSEGSYILGSLRWDMIDSNGCINIDFLNISAVFDSMTALNANSQWQATDTSWCNPIGINVQLHNEVPTTIKLNQNYPNPFNPTTRIKYEIPNSADVQLRLYDAAGREIETAVDDRLDAGVYEFVWNSSGYASGVYFYTLVVSSTSGDVFKETKKMVLVK
jgi:hypothetical protein